MKKITYIKKNKQLARCENDRLFYFLAAQPANPADHDNNGEVENNVFELDDNFFDNLMRCQVRVACQVAELW